MLQKDPLVEGEYIQGSTETSPKKRKFNRHSLHDEFWKPSII